MALTRDHRPDDEEEEERIVAASGSVINNRVNGNPGDEPCVWRLEVQEGREGRAEPSGHRGARGADL